MNQTDDCLIFLHIPKAAGRTLTSVIARQYPSSDIVSFEGSVGELSESQEVSRARVILGPLYFGVHQRVPGPSTYVTLLREPIERIVSLHRYIVSNSRHPLHAQVEQQSLASFVISDVDADEVNNGQTKQLAGLKEGHPARSSLETAKGNLERFFALAGLVERFDESLVLLKKRFGWRMPFYIKENVTVVASGVDGVAESDLHLIAERNQLDLELYEFACGLFEEVIREQGPFFGARVALFKASNRAAISFRELRRMVRR